MEPVIFHIDVNSAYLSWTSVENLKSGGPDLRQIPSIIGGDQSSRHGIVLAKSLQAKACGVSTGEPVAQALKKCPNLTVAPPDHKLYKEYSRRLMGLLSSYTLRLEQLSIDECFLDVTDLWPDRQEALAAAFCIKDAVRERFGFTVNVGVSCRKVLAKMASDFQKPDRVHTLWPEELPAKLWPLPVGELYMAGRSSVQVLQKLGILTVGDLASSDPELIASHLKSHGRLLWEYANGIDPSPVVSQRQEAKGVGNSTTLAEDISRREDALPVLQALSDTVSARLRKAGQLAGTLTVEIKYYNFQSASHQMPLLTPANDSASLYRAACSLFDELWSREPIRLLGLRGTNLAREGAPTQMNLFDLDFSQFQKDEKHKKLDQALSDIRGRFGKDAVMSAGALARRNKDTEPKR